MRVVRDINMKRHRDVVAMVRSSIDGDTTSVGCIGVSSRCLFGVIIFGFALLLIASFLIIFATKGESSVPSKATMKIILYVSYGLIALGCIICGSSCVLYIIAINLGRRNADDESSIYPNDADPQSQPAIN